MESEQHRREIDWSKFMEWSLTIVGKELQFAQLGIDYRGTIKTFLVRGGWFLFEFNKMAVSLPHKPDAWELLPSDRIPAIRGETRTKKLSFITERKRQGIIIEEIYDT
ncbi:MAG TPA: hypothetical protein VFT82_00925, partial [Candidatus Paceibacterota bacterium]|nr:hypothetical protein [Candidatus Paceibacterota bacterium]